MADVLRADQTSAIIGCNSEMGRRILGQWSIRMIADHSFYLVRMTGHRRLCLPAFGPTNTHTRVHVVCIFRWKQALLLAVVNAGPFLGFASVLRRGPARFVHAGGKQLINLFTWSALGWLIFLHFPLFSSLEETRKRTAHQKGD